MGILEEAAKKSRRSLAARSLVGRSPACVIASEDPRVSAEHASVFWSGAHWEVRDLGSSNGTALDGRRLAPGERSVLRAGSELRFAGNERWLLVCALPPVASATGAGGHVRVAEGGLLVLPDAASPMACSYEDGDGVWWLEIGEEVRPAVDQETLVAGEPWVLSIPPVLAGDLVPTTVKLGPSLMLGAVTLRFAVSGDEEHIELSVVQESGATPPVARAHHYALLTLARARLRDREAGSVPSSERGWLYVDDLLRMLRTDPAKLNLDIFRARQHLAQLGLTDAGTIVERRPGSRQIRLGTDRIEITRI